MVFARNFCQTLHKWDEIDRRHARCSRIPITSMRRSASPNLNATIPERKPAWRSSVAAAQQSRKKHENAAVRRSLRRRSLLNFISLSLSRHFREILAFCALPKHNHAVRHRFCRACPPWAFPPLDLGRRPLVWRSFFACHGRGLFGRLPPVRPGSRATGAISAISRAMSSLTRA